MQMANRDIKPENILYTTQEGGTNPALPDRAQICDFTTVVECAADNLKVTGEAGSIAFMPPECFISVAYQAKPMDIWALGVSIYAIVFDRLPFDGSSPEEVKSSICKDALQIPQICSPELRTLLEALLSKEVGQRPEIEAVIMNYDWLASV